MKGARCGWGECSWCMLRALCGAPGRRRSPGHHRPGWQPARHPAHPHGVPSGANCAKVRSAVRARVGTCHTCVPTWARHSMLLWHLSCVCCWGCGGPIRGLGGGGVPSPVQTTAPHWVVRLFVGRGAVLTPSPAHATVEPTKQCAWDPFSGRTLRGSGAPCAPRPTRGRVSQQNG